MSYYGNHSEETMKNKHLDWLEKNGKNRIDIFKEMLKRYEDNNK